ncbi:hypothetical protein K2X14_10130 [Acetobacter sp. TBRC 12305]|uniref:Uncharacterized protein n=1 Tax=Acetobacter garciniae TaxID=2817435 RepID=A0A939KRS8_9PROT|nr:hypothetical protein [Acetobacter garciniae]MBO1326066.1 hypothetical protein [Acetobacter garciniae]MBX0345190.1 hypothetical protein [Acetobacter garciniae]
MTTSPDRDCDTAPSPYRVALGDGLFDTTDLPRPMACEVDRYERAILGLETARQALAWPLFTDFALADIQAGFCAEGIGELVQAVRDLHTAQPMAQNRISGVL